ncbi:MAG: hypothetical protein K2X27_18370 [Candidatus Obscuribacterales bacterium]|nr:hypothetical protein [Candidatus Obscuribacterales bacterium]
MKVRKIATVDERIRGAIAMALTIGTLGWASQHPGEPRLQIAGIIAGLLYLMTTITIVFKDVD